YHLSDFRVSSRRLPEHPGLKRICIQQLDTGGVLVANHSIRQNSIVLFECFLETTAGDLPGDWGFTGDDKPPWNVGPESTIAISPACFFNVPEQLNVPENPRFRIEFLTATGKRFSHVFSRQAPRQSNSAEPARRAA
ncbi:MAG: hypothetical protein KDB14_21685, partial [Planctomycetales bacterium]|nr:hypothetical protein [Planctomycetales bacterium]